AIVPASEVERSARRFGVRTAAAGERIAEWSVQPADLANRSSRNGENRSYTEDFMHRFGERLIYAAPLLFVLSGACSSDSLPATATDAGTTPTTDASFGTDGATTSDATTTTMTVTIPAG